MVDFGGGKVFCVMWDDKVVYYVFVVFGLYDCYVGEWVVGDLYFVVVEDIIVVVFVGVGLYFVGVGVVVGFG